MIPVPSETLPQEAERVTAPPIIGQNTADATLSEAWVTIRKRKWLILICGFLGLLYGLYQGATQVRLYEATGTIEIRSGSSNEYRIPGSASGSESSSHLPTQVAILKSENLLLTVARDLDLANNRDFMGSKGPTRHVDVDDPVVRQTVVGLLSSDISISTLPKTDLIRVSCHTLNGKLSADIVNKLVVEFRNRSFTSRLNATNHVSEFFSHQLDDLKRQVAQSQEEMIDLQKKLGVLGFDPTHNQITSNLDELTHAAGAAQLSRIMAEVRVGILNGTDRNALDESIDAGVGAAPSQVGALRAQLETARAQLAFLNPNDGPNLPAVKALRSQIAELTRAIGDEQNRLLAQARENLVAARAQEAQTRSALESEKTAAFNLRNDLVAFTIRQREFEANRTLYEGLEQRLRTAGIQAGLESTEIEPVDEAVAPIAPSLKPRSTIMIIDSMIMLIVGIIIAFVLDSLDTGLRSVAEIENVSGLPSLALIPRTRRGPDGPNVSVVARNLNVIANPKSQFAEAFRALRTSLLLSTAGHEPKTILLTSATPSEGKTTVSINLACVLAQRDVRVLLIDADLRRPTVHHRFGLNGKVGLTSVLTGSVSLEAAVQNIAEIPTLDVLVSGPVPPFPTEMLGSETMRALLEKCTGIYTHVVMDSPPLLSVTDSVVLARDADAVVMIVRHGKSSKHAVRRARDLLLRAGAPITGIALNAVDLTSPEYYAYYGYYGYSGYASAGVDSAAWESQSGTKSTTKGDTDEAGKGGKQ